ncbi:Tim44 domain-containing protein [Oxalicibacterium solurbis]|uniref:Membrane protein n=1 Tax=Oxalicibacterium solurbis TaxID=69280 RepID=A0A8J3F5L5_9BURK|nr:TIM44-like domain-containing protein [Oxalicibacterium solurbis]GGI53713.1 membrane protein [Oxalicibacterium solurbis]
MKRLLMALAVVTSSMMFIAPEAEAKRMGGGGSFGKQSQSYKRAAPPQQSQATPSKPDATAAAGGAAGAAAKPSMMRNILGGALLGLGLGALLSHLGIGGALASMISTILMVALLAFAAMFIFRMIRNRSAGNQPQPAFQHGYSARSQTPEIGSGIANNQPAALQSSGAMVSAAAVDANEVPADFDVESFLRNAKSYFIRLQAAWDRGDVNDIREFTTPEMFGELRLQLQERGDTKNVTDVVSLDAVFYGVEKVGDEYIASVKFSGMIREADHAPTEPFTEAWNLVKPINGDGGWVLAGIQQL